MSRSNGCQKCSNETTILIPVVVLTLLSWLRTSEFALAINSKPMLTHGSNLLDNTISSGPQFVSCGTIVKNITYLMVKNPHHPESTYTKTICEIVIEKADSSISKLRVNFKQLELYRPNTDGQCLHDRFSVYTDLNAPVTPVICGSHTGKTLMIPFMRQLTSLIISVTTSDLDHDRAWLIEISQEK